MSTDWLAVATAIVLNRATCEHCKETKVLELYSRAETGEKFRWEFVESPHKETLRLCEDCGEEWLNNTCEVCGEEDGTYTELEDLDHCMPAWEGYMCGGCRESEMMQREEHKREMAESRHWDERIDAARGK